MKEHIHIELSQKLIDKISEFFPSKKYKDHSPLFYEGQIPISGYLVLNGSVQLTNKKKNKKLISSGSLLGLAELLLKKPSKVSAEAFPNTEVCFLDKSSLHEFEEHADAEMQSLLKEIQEIKK